MRCGISTACFYPEDTLASLKNVIDLGVPVTEVFINTFSELEDSYVAKLLDAKRSSNIEISSVHPFASVLEGFFFASSYTRKWEDGVRLYRRFFEICRVLGADKMVFHGDHEYNTRWMPMQEYARRFGELAQIGREYGVCLCHENVAYCRLKNTRRVQDFARCAGEDAAFVLDLKQLRRKNGSLKRMVSTMGAAIRQVHISDHDQTATCLLPGEGNMDFTSFITQLQRYGYTDNLLIEVYSNNFTQPVQLRNAMEYINGILKTLDVIH